MSDEQEKTLDGQATDAIPTPTEVVANTEAATEAVPVEQEAVPTEAVPTAALPHRDIKPGMVVRVHERIKDLNAKGEERQRVQVFEGTVLGIGGEGVGRTMTVRKISDGIGVEKIYPLASPSVEKIEVVKRYRVRRAKLWFLRRDKKHRKMQEIQ